ncbi:cutinase family protein [Pseudonocardia sp. KRD291]|uniref:cutinase family protein n=1 Tax=Pseudonocardia sp. KRD291 TaxID=2792007 RepID=UPI001C4A19C7|nr:cutinase family protein [Pseudonocardia sp. KRD291]MBW0104098.1 cutinase family protein [Pseudonocardia sp. KRD291]
MTTTSGSSRRIGACLATAFVSAAGALVVATPASAQASTCSDVQVVFARGTGERAGLGSVGTPFVRAVTSTLGGRSVSSYAVDYPAASNQRSGSGTTDMTNRVTSEAQRCPDTKFVIGGYSQGAAVTDSAVGVRVAGGGGTPIPASLAPRVAAVVVYGNPAQGQGGSITRSPNFGSKAVEYCNSGDGVCGRRGTTPGGHLSYSGNGTIQSGAEFVAGKVG